MPTVSRRRRSEAALITLPDTGGQPLSNLQLLSKREQKEPHSKNVAQSTSLLHSLMVAGFPDGKRPHPLASKI